MKKAKLIYPWKCWTYNAPHSDGKTPVEIDYECAQGPRLGSGKVIRPWQVGDITHAWAGAPGTGYIRHRITRIDKRGIWGVVVEDTIRELTPAEVY